MVHQESTASPKSLIEKEVRARPIATMSTNPSNAQVTDHRGPGDSNALTKRGVHNSIASPQSASLSEAEQRVRPVPSSTQSRDIRVGDHRGVGDTNALTRRKHFAPVFEAPTTSLSDAEQRARPAPSSNNAEHTQVSDYRGVGDTRTITRKTQSTSPSTASAGYVSLSESAEGGSRQRPVPSASAQSTEPASLDEEDLWWDDNASRRTGKAAGKTTDDTQKEAAVSSPEAEEPSSSDEPPHISFMQSLLNEEKPGRSHRALAAAAAAAPIAEIKASSLQSLLKDEQPIKGIKGAQLRMPERNREWWAERPKRPKNYTKHSQSLNTAYSFGRKNDAPRDYGDVVTASAEADDDESSSDEEGDDNDDAATAAEPQKEDK